MQELVNVSTGYVAVSTAATPFAILVNASADTSADALAGIPSNHPISTMSERDHFVECLEACGDCV